MIHPILLDICTYIYFLPDKNLMSGLSKTAWHILDVMAWSPAAEVVGFSGVKSLICYKFKQPPAILAIRIQDNQTSTSKNKVIKIAHSCDRLHKISPKIFMTCVVCQFSKVHEVNNLT